MTKDKPRNPAYICVRVRLLDPRKVCQAEGAQVKLILHAEEMRQMKMARVILFTSQMDAMSRFYGEVLGLEQVTNEKGWREFAAGGATIALHSGPSSPGRKGPKIAFYAKDVAALREKLVKRGAKFGDVRAGEVLHLCDGKDPDGNPIQLSNR